MRRIFTHIGSLATCAAYLNWDDPGLGQNAAMVVEDGRFVWIGSAEEIPSALSMGEVVDLGGRLVVPGLVDSHTHLAFGGWRAGEFALRCQGATYQEIAARGGGIMATVRQTRAATPEQLRDRAAGFLREMLAQGVTTVEAKSGYGLTVADELKLLRVYRALAESSPQRIVATFLGAHTVPAEFKSQRGEYLRQMVEEALPAIAAEGLARFADVFVEDGAFTADEARDYLQACRQYGLRAKLHVDQLHDGGGATLAAAVGAISADHLEYTGDAGIAALAAAGVIAVALPVASLYLRQPFLDARRYQAAGVPVAVATDFNPGTAPCASLPLAMNLACTQNRMTPAAALRGATIVAARAVAEEEHVGSIEVGKRADFIVLNEPSVDQWLYRLPPAPPCRVVIGGETVVDTAAETAS